MTCRVGSRTCRSIVSPYCRTLICAVVGVTPSSTTRAAEQRVDEGALAGVELADDDEQEELVELLDRAVERGLVLRRRIEPDEGGAQPREDPPLVLQKLVLVSVRIFVSMRRRFVQDPGHGARPELTC